MNFQKTVKIGRYIVTVLYPLKPSHGDFSNIPNIRLGKLIITGFKL